MALDPIATAADLADRNITIPVGMEAVPLLQAASDAVRDAAGCPITVTTSTVELVSSDWCELDLPGGPVSAVASVVIEGVTLSESVLTNGCYSKGWRRVGNRLLFTGVRFTPPTVITVTYTHGYGTIPADIVDLVCAMTAMAASEDDYGASSRLDSWKLATAAETYSHPAGTESPSPFALPDSLRQTLRARFNATVAVIGVR